MVLGLLTDPVLRAALRAAASPEEDVLLNGAATLASRYGFPRLLVHDDESRARARLLLDARRMKVLPLTDAVLAEWDADRRGARILRSREAYATDRLRGLLREGVSPSWVDQAFRELSLAAGAALPIPLRGFGRRVMEFPSRYDDLHGLSGVTRLSRGALKARFRRRGLASPSSYLRWFRIMAAGHVLRDPSTTTLQASHRLGFTTDGNFCRAIATTTGLTPTELRSAQGWQRLVVLFASRYLQPEALRAWASLNRLFQRDRVA